MRISPLLTDEAVLAEIGSRMAARRIDLELTQAAVAEQAGIAKRTLERMEAGHSSQLSSLIRVLRVLDDLSGSGKPYRATVGPRPMDLLQRKGKVRRRASSRRAKNTSGKPWHWNDD